MVGKRDAVLMNCGHVLYCSHCCDELTKKHFELNPSMNSKKRGKRMNEERKMIVRDCKIDCYTCKVESKKYMKLIFS
jgi:hypothetical protein